MNSPPSLLASLKMGAEVLPSCPFCDYTTRDHYFLLQHVETVHPEGTSPFVVNEDATGEGMETDVRESTRESSPEYIECQCGEFCILAEFESHLEMHYAEGTGIEENSRTSSDSDAPTSKLDHVKAASPAMEISPPLTLQSVVSASSKSSSGKSVVRYRSRNTSHKNQNSVMDFVDMLRPSTAPPPRKVAGSSRPEGHQRLGRAELGPHAHEEEMPEWLRKQLERGAKVTVVNHIGSDGRLMRIETIANEFPGIVPVLAQLCEQDHAVSRAYICHPDLTHVVKMAKEGGFCGYRNIQMLLSYIQNARSEGHQQFQGKLPSILQLQDMIESAWDQGFNPMGRIETGGIRGTRKYIGTPEAQGLLQSLNVGCRADAFTNGKELAVDQLLYAVEQYFLEGISDVSHKVCRTSRPPMYFQHPGHSLTVVGFERHRNGSCNLLVLDPMFKPSPGIYRLINLRFRTSSPEKLLKAYRRGGSYLSKYSNFEILKLTATAPGSPGW